MLNICLIFKAEEAEKAKPKFLTKEERAAEALRRRAEQVEALRAVQDEEKKKREEFNKEGKQELRDMERANRYPRVLPTPFTMTCWYF